MPLFSVVVPVYNKAATIQRAVESVLNQSVSDWELILVVDPSRDGSEKKVEAINAKNVTILQRQAPGPGGYGARNTGIYRASGELIAFLDADDEWLPDHLRRIQGMNETFAAIDVFVANYERISENSSVLENPFGIRYRSRGDHVITLNEYLRRAVQGHDLFKTSALVVRRSALPLTALFPEHRCTRAGDVDAFLRLLERCRSLGWSAGVTVRYHRDAPHMVTKTLPPQIRHCIRPTVVRMASAPSAHDDELRHLVRRFYNQKIKGAIRSQMRRGRVGLFSLGRLYTQYELLWIIRLLPFLLIPSRLRQRLRNLMRRSL